LWQLSNNLANFLAGHIAQTLDQVSVYESCMIIVLIGVLEVPIVVVIYAHAVFDMFGDVLLERLDVPENSKLKA
jgi:hypothetical protein